MPRCAEGQTWNRTLKACREKKRAGRTRRAVAPKLVFIFRVSFAGMDGLNDMPEGISMMEAMRRNRAASAPVISKHAAKIKKWYKGFADDYELDGVVLKHLGDDIFQGTVRVAPGKTVGDFEDNLEMFVDPDEDGNYPIMIGRKERLLAGELVSAKFA